MREFPFLIDSDALQGKQFVPVDGLSDAGSAQAVQAFKLDVGGEDMYGVITISDWDEEVKDVLHFPHTPLGFALPGPSQQASCCCLPSSAHRFLQGELCLPCAFPEPLLTGRVLPAVASSHGQPPCVFEQLLPALGQCGGVLPTWGHCDLREQHTQIEGRAATH